MWELQTRMGTRDLHRTYREMVELDVDTSTTDR
jgi:hypothetical protein